ncbi:MAG: cyanoexosortase A [Verrucomicrobia bacterium]|nr:cyanoexosortase A [Verrucomicrobiota bacterium]
MRNADSNNARSIRWLAVILAVLVGLDLVLVQRHQSSGQFGITLLCWSALIMSLRRHTTFLRHSRVGPAVWLAGYSLIALLFVNLWWRGLSWNHYLSLYPIWVGIALGLLAGGWAGVARFWRELTILFFLGIPHGFLLDLVDLSEVTAQFAALLLHYVGKDVILTGTEISLPGGAVEVVKSCDGTGAIAYLTCLAMVFLLLFPTTRWQRVVTLPLAIGIAFGTNAVRVAMLAVITASAGEHAFDYWHTGQGSMLWTGLPVLLFGVFCFFALRSSGRPTECAPEVTAASGGGSTPGCSVEGPLSSV